jgi:uridine phosphorylase
VASDQNRTGGYVLVASSITCNWATPNSTDLFSQEYSSYYQAYKSRKTMTIPLFEYDPSREALIEPSHIVKPQNSPVHCVICFFREVIDKVISEKNAKVIAENRWEDGPHPVYEILHNGHRLAFYHPGVSASMAAGLLEEVIALGCRKFIACGGCGVLVNDIEVGNLIVVSGAIRDEGVSYHYVPPQREIIANEAGVNALVMTLDKLGMQYRIGKTWTTDAPYRETPAKIARRREEGCLSVEMEAAGMMAVAQFRNVLLGQVLYGGDDLSGGEWDNRAWQSRGEIRKKLFWICAGACLSIPN